MFHSFRFYFIKCSVKGVPHIRAWRKWGKQCARVIVGEWLKHATPTTPVTPSWGPWGAWGPPKNRV